MCILTGAAVTQLNSASTLAAGDPVVVAAGDIACDPTDTGFNGGTGTSTRCRQLATYNLIPGLAPAAVLPLGDEQYNCGGYNAFLQSYALSWGGVKSISRPVVGNHEYLTTGGTDCDTTGKAAGYYQYFGAAAGDPAKGYYSYDLGAWHIVALNSNCSNVGGCSSGSPQETWLRNDLATHTSQCIMAYWHIPLWSSGGRAQPNTKAFMQDLYNAGADLVLTGHDHTYERFAPQDPSGFLDNTRGIREFVVGTGGGNHTPISTIAANSVVRNADTFGVLKVTLHATSYDWQFVPEAGKTFTDSGTASCHNTMPPTPTPPSSTGFVPVADAYVDSANPTINYGKSTALRTDGSPVQNSYLRFNVQGVGGSILHATLRVYNNTTAATGFSVRGVVDNTWGETTITYGNAPAAGTIVANASSVTAGSWTSLDVTSLVTGNGLVSLALTTTSPAGKSFGSRESANPPQLVVDSTGGTVSNTPTSAPAATNTPTRTPTSTPVNAPTNTPTTAPSGGTVTLNPAADAYVYETYPTTNYGSATTLRIDASPIQRGYLRFSVSGVNGPVTKATLRVYANSSLSTGFNVARVTDNTWGETTINYSNAPALGTVINPSGAATTGAWISIDVTSYVTGNGTFSFALDPLSSTALSLASRESGANAPQLLIQW